MKAGLISPTKNVPSLLTIVHGFGGRASDAIIAVSLSSERAFDRVVILIPRSFAFAQVLATELVPVAPVGDLTRDAWVAVRAKRIRVSLALDPVIIAVVGRCTIARVLLAELLVWSISDGTSHAFFERFALFLSALSAGD